MHITRAWIGHRNRSAPKSSIWPRSCWYYLGKSNKVFRKRKNMLWTICVILFVLWALGMVTSYTMGGIVHILLVLAVVVLVIQLIQGRRTIV